MAAETLCGGDTTIIIIVFMYMGLTSLHASSQMWVRTVCPYHLHMQHTLNEI